MAGPYSLKHARSSRVAAEKGVRQRKDECLDIANKKRNTGDDLRGGLCLQLSPQYSPIQLPRCLSFPNALNIAQTQGSQSLPSFAKTRVVNCTSLFLRIALRRDEARRRDHILRETVPATWRYREQWFPVCTRRGRGRLPVSTVYSGRGADIVMQSSPLPDSTCPLFDGTKKKRKEKPLKPPVAPERHRRVYFH